MNTRRSYKLTTPTLGISADDVRIPVRMPADAVITVVRPETGENEFVVVEWEGKRLSMFTVDLMERGQLVGAAAGPA